MPIIIEYPHASLKNALELAHAVDELGGRATTEMAAEKRGMRMGGGYKMLVGAAVKYGLLTSKGGYVETTLAFKDYKLAYSAEEGEKVLQRCLLQPAVFQKIYERFKGRPLPLSHFEKLLIREFGVAEAASSRVAKYFIDGIKMCGLLGPSNTLLEVGSTLGVEPAGEGDHRGLEPGTVSAEPQKDPESPQSDIPRPGHNGYTVRISGPGMDSVVAINEADDLDIVEVMLRKVRRQLTVTKLEGEE